MGADAADSPDRSFGWRGWILVVAIVFAFLIIPLIIIYVPPTWVSFRFAFLILPMLPAVLLAVLAVWSTTRP